MSVPVLSGITLLDPADSDTGWSGWGQNSGKWGSQTEIKKEGSGAAGLQPNQTGDGGWGYDSVGGTLDLSTELLMVWIYIGSPAFINSFGSTPAGVYIRITDSASSWTTTYDDYYVGGSDIAWCQGGWHLVAIDCGARTRDRGSGTVTLSTIERVGVGFNIAATASKSTVIAIDAFFYGTELEVTGPSFIDGSNGIDINSGGTLDRNDGGSFVTDGWEVGDYIKIVGSATAANDGIYELTAVAATLLTTGETFTQDTANTTLKIYASVTLEDIYQKDGPTDDDWFGVVDKNPQGSYVVNYNLALGDASGALDCFFLTRGENIILADQPLEDAATGYDYFTFQEDTGETHVHFGDCNGTGESRVGFGGSVFFSEASIFSAPTYRNLDFSTGITEAALYGTSFFLCNNIDLYDAASPTDHRFTGNQIVNPIGVFDPGGFEVRDLVLSGYVSTTGGAMDWGTNIDIKRSSFLANYAAIYHTAAGSVSYDALKFGGNTYDVRLNNASNLTVNASNLANPATKLEDSTGTITIVNTKILTVTVQEPDGTKINGARVGIYKTSDRTEIHIGTTNASGVTQKTDYNYTVDTDVYIRSRLSPDGATRYTPSEVPGTIDANGLNVVVTLFEDEIAA